MSVISYFLAAVILWLTAGVFWSIKSLGRKNSKGTALDQILDKLLITPILPLAWLFGKLITRNRYKNEFYRKETDEN